MNKILPIILVVVLSGCASHIILGTEDTITYHPTATERLLGQKSRTVTIDGTGYGFPASDVEVLLDAQVNGLRMRQVKMEADVCESGYYHFIELDGFIGPDSTIMVERLIKRLETCISVQDGEKVPNKIYMNSDGGYLYDGYAMGRLFRKYEMATMVVGNQKCSSSCAAAFLGGVIRRVAENGVLIFHSPYTKTGIGINCDDKGEVSGLREYYNEFLNKDDSKLLLDRTLSYCSSTNGWRINSGAATLYNITN